MIVMTRMQHHALRRVLYVLLQRLDETYPEEAGPRALLLLGEYGSGLEELHDVIEAHRHDLRAMHEELEVEAIRWQDEDKRGGAVCP